MKQWEVFFNSQDAFYKRPFGAVICGEEITFRLHVKCSLKPINVILRIWIHDEKQINMKLVETVDGIHLYEGKFVAPVFQSIIWYYFIIGTETGIIYYGNQEDFLGGRGKVYTHPPRAYQLTVFDKNFKTPSWFKDAIMYQIFVDRFFNGNENGSIHKKNDEYIIHNDWNERPYYEIDYEDGIYLVNDFFGGNLKGIIKKLNYLKKLGIDIIYLNPIFEAYSNHKYDTGDYKKIDPMFGDKKDLEELCEQVEKLGMHIILDGVFSHTGSDSVYFNKKGTYPSVGAYQSLNSPYYKWYTFLNYPNEYTCWWGFDTLPNINEMEASFVDFIIEGENSVIKHYSDAGISGWRLDVADELPEEFIKKLRACIKEKNEEHVLIGEVWEDATRKHAYGKLRHYLLGDELDSVMNYPLRRCFIDFFLKKIDGETFNRIIMSLYENYPLEAFYALMNIIGTHDTERIITLLSGAPEGVLNRRQQAVYKCSREERELAKKRLKMISLMQMTFPGVPCIYYGDEAGLEGMKDPFNRRTYPWGKEDQELLDWYKKITGIRKNIDALKTGSYEPLYYKDTIYAYERCITNGKDVFNQKRNNGRVIAIFNVSMDVTHTIEIKTGGKNKLINILDGEEIEIITGKIIMKMVPLSYKLLIDKE
ncbi:MAG: glycoside hydrolase family 13 protein [Marinisporobacter sp.]|jgi:4-alpha-glucanotransferase|nr:glycoside hydrolase family 13 protein [Marinisporobacter sp.]